MENIKSLGEIGINLSTDKFSQKLAVAAKHLNEMSKEFDEIDKEELVEAEELELDLEEVAKYIRKKLAERGLKAASIPEQEIIYLLKMETEYLEKNGFTGKLSEAE